MSIPLKFQRLTKGDSYRMLLWCDLCGKGTSHRCVVRGDLPNVRQDLQTCDDCYGWTEGRGRYNSSGFPPAVNPEAPESDPYPLKKEPNFARPEI